MTDRAAQYAEHITKIKASSPDFDDLAKQWKKVIVDRMRTIVDEQYDGLGLSVEQKLGMAERDADKYRASLSDDEFRKQMTDLHDQAVKALIRQLEFERDHPDAKDQEPQQEDSEGDSPFVEAFVTWLGTRVHGNIAAAKRESGEGAKILRATLGISWKDIKKHGIFGGKNSFFRKPFG